jgi:CheY-like chemotaxis protein
MILEHAGYEVMEAVDGVEGVVRAREHHRALILMDISIPRSTATRRLTS